MLRILYAYEAFVNPLNPFSDRYEHCVTWSCDCGASGEGDPCDCPTCGCESRTVDGPLPGDDEPDYDPPDHPDLSELGGRLC